MNDETPVNHDHLMAVLAIVTIGFLFALSGFAIPIALLFILGAAAVMAVARHVDPVAPRPGWFGRAVLSGFVASAGMVVAFIVAYAVANAFATMMAGSTRSASTAQMAVWTYNLVHNNLTDLAQRSLYLTLGLHFAAGITLAAVYARYFEERLPGPYWARGLVYAGIPGLLSVLVFFPMAGAGFMGMALGAGAFPFVGNMLLHGVYGATLGLVCGPAGDRLPGDEWVDDPEEVAYMQHAESLASRGVVIGLVAGLIAGIIGGGFFPGVMVGPREATAVGLALIGGAAGALVGSLMGLTDDGLAHAHT